MSHTYFKNNRLLRINQLIREKLGEIFLKEFNLTKKYFFTITRVETSKDFNWTKINLSVWPKEKSREILSFLKKRRNKIRYLLAQQIKLFKIPQLNFFLDKEEEKQKRIEEILDTIKNLK